MARGLLYTLLSLDPREVRRKAARARRVRPILRSHAAELQYRIALRDEVVLRCRKAGEGVASGMRAHWPAVHDERAPGLSALIEHAATHFGDIRGIAERLAKAAATKTLQGVDERLAKNLQRAVGVNISGYLAPDQEIGDAMRAAAAANVELIVSIPHQYLDGVRAATEKAFVAGRRWEELAKEIGRVGDVTDTRARIIARDQVSKMNAAFNEVRQTSIGIESYGWSGALDKRERPSHRAMEGTTHRWDSPPLVDGEHVHPGEAILCRCASIPRINFEQLAPEGGALQEAA